MKILPDNDGYLPYSFDKIIENANKNTSSKEIFINKHEVDADKGNRRLFTIGTYFRIL